MCIHIQSVTYMHPDKDVLFSNVSFSMGKGEKVALIGNNGSTRVRDKDCVKNRVKRAKIVRFTLC